MAQQIVNGLMLGAIYVLIAVAFSLTMGILNFLNFTIPGLFMLGGMLTWGLIAAGWPAVPAAAAALLAAALVSLFIERVSYRRMRGGDPEIPLVSSLAVLILLQNLVLVRFGSDQQAFPALLPDLNLRPLGLVIGTPQLVSLGLALLLVAWLSGFLGRTNSGRRIRAIAESPETATLLGIDVDRIVPLVFLCAGVFTALAGILFALNYLQVSPFMGEGVGFKGISAMIVGGMGSIWGAVAGGLLIGLAEVLSIHFFGANVANISVYGLLLLLLILRPQGLFGAPMRRERL